MARKRENKRDSLNPNLTPNSNFSPNLSANPDLNPGLGPNHNPNLNLNLSQPPAVPCTRTFTTGRRYRAAISVAVSVAFFSLAVSLVPLPCAAEPWKVEIDASLLMTQTSYSDNWTGGEAGSLAWSFNSSFLAQKRFNPKALSKNTVKLAFGQLHNQDKETREWDRPAKYTDLVDLESVLNLTLGGFVDPFASARIETQFLDNTDPETDRYFNPATFTEALGVAKNIIDKEENFWALRLGGGFRQHLNRDVLDTLSGKRETVTTNDGGIEFVSDLKYPVADRLDLTSKLNVFKAFFYSEADKLEGLPNEDHWKSPDVRWDNTLTASISKYVMANLYVQLLYDREVDAGWRFKQTLGLGLTYKLK